MRSWLLLPTGWRRTSPGTASAPVIASPCGCRVEAAIVLLACSRNGYVCCPSMHRDHTVGEIIALVDRMRATALIALPGYGADSDRHDVFAALAGRDFLRFGWRVGPADA